MDDLEITEGVQRLSPVLRSAGIPHAFGGAIAYGFYGIPRGTNDWDLNIFLPESSAPMVFRLLEPLGVVIPPDGVAEVEKTGQIRLNWAGKKLDLFFAYADFHRVAQQRTRDTVFDGTPIYALSAEDIIVFKVIFNRAHDWRDIERVFQRMGAEIDLDYVTRWLASMLGEDDSRIEHLRRIARGEPA